MAGDREDRYGARVLKEDRGITGQRVAFIEAEFQHVGLRASHPWPRRPSDPLSGPRCRWASPQRRGHTPFVSGCQAPHPPAQGGELFLVQIRDRDSQHLSGAGEGVGGQALGASHTAPVNSGHAAESLHARSLIKAGVRTSRQPTKSTTSGVNSRLLDVRKRSQHASEVGEPLIKTRLSDPLQEFPLPELFSKAHWLLSLQL